jgi:Fur family transcriptional regulator, ferric uptake regulator
MTRQRRVILEALGKTKSHPTAAELYDTVRRRLPKISLGTVYRNLELLAVHGEIQKLELCGAPARFDATGDGHYHVRCVECGRVDDVSLPPLPEVEAAIRRAVPYELKGLRLECWGVCPRCQAREPSTGQAERMQKASTQLHRGS